MKRLPPPPVPLSQCQREDIQHTGDSDRLSVVYLTAETRGPGFSEGTIQWLPVWEALVLCLIARLTRQIKRPILLIGDLILSVTFLDFWLAVGFLMQEAERFGKGRFGARPGICLVADRRPPLGAAVDNQTKSQITSSTKLRSPSLHFPSDAVSETSLQIALCLFID